MIIFCTDKLIRQSVLDDPKEICDNCRKNICLKMCCVKNLTDTYEEILVEKYTFQVVHVLDLMITE